MKKKLDTLKNAIENKNILDDETRQACFQIIENINQLLSRHSIDSDNLASLDFIVEHLEQWINEPNNQVWHRLSKEEKAFFLSLEDNELLRPLSSIIGLYKPFMMQKDVYYAYIKALRTVQALSNDDDTELTKILGPIKQILEKIIKNPMEKTVWDWTDEAEQQAILRLFHYRNLSKLGDDLLRVYYPRGFHKRIEHLKSAALKDITRVNPVETNMDAQKTVAPLQRYLKEQNNSTEIEKKVNPLIAAFEDILSSTENKEEIKQQIQNTYILLSGDPPMAYQEILAMYSNQATIYKQSSDLKEQLLGSLMFQLSEALYEEPHYEIHFNRINTPTTQKYLAPLDKYLHKHPGTKLEGNLVPLMRVFSEMLEANEKDKKEAIKHIHQTVELLYGRLSPEAYQKIGQKAKGARSPLRQLMGILMMALSGAVLAFGITTGLVPASVVGGVGIAAGFSIFQQASEHQDVAKQMVKLSKADLKEIKKNVPIDHVNQYSSRSGKNK